MAHTTSQPQILCTTSQPQILLEAKRERLTLRELRKLPPAIYDEVVRRIVSGDSSRAIARWLHCIRPNTSAERWRKRLAVLAREVGRVQLNNSNLSRTQKEINAFNEAIKKAKAEINHPVLRPQPGTVEQLEAIVTKAVTQIHGEQMLRYTWMVAQKRVDRMVELEQRTNLIFPDGYRNVAVLCEIAQAMLKAEQTRQIASNVAENISPVAKEMAAFDEVDRNLIRQAYSKVIEMSGDSAVEACAVRTSAE